MPEIANAPAWIAVDWGTSNMRAWAMGPDDAVLARATSEKGMGRLAPHGFEAALLEAVGTWLVEDRTLPILACGMVGARQGWVEAAYNRVPTAPILGCVTPAPVSDKRISVEIIPGVCQLDPSDVMRGEETQLAGYVSRHGGEGTVCLPGTHTKWVHLRAGEIVSFHTHMTGELFGLLSTQSVLRHSVGTDGWDDTAFAEGVEKALGMSGALSGLFGIRAASLLDDVPAGAARAKLSGLLIGGEIAAMAETWDSESIGLVGADGLSGLYETAIGLAGGQVRRVDAEAMTLAGLVAARRALVGEKG